MVQPIISVCIPTYNGTKFLRDCLDSVLGQSFADFEILLIDDSSLDGTWELAESYASQDSRIRLFRNEKNLGLVGNWNRCLDLAGSEWIKFVFQDDKIGPDCLKNFLEYARSDVGLMVCRRNYIYENVYSEEIIEHEQYLAEYCLPTVLPEGGVLAAGHFCRLALEKLAVNFVGEPSAVMLHRRVRKKFGGFNPFFVQLCDFEYWARIACYEGLIFVPDTLASFRIHSASKTADNKLAREFRTEIVDPLLLRYEFAYSPRFGPIRAMARQLGLDLKKSVAVAARWAETTARRLAKDVLIPDNVALTEWRSIVDAHPNLTTSSYARVQQLNDVIDRQVLWRFRDSGLRFKEPNTRCPIILCVEVEPDDGGIEPDSVLAWKGFEAVWEFLSMLRFRLAEVTGARVHYTWMLRLVSRNTGGQRRESVLHDYLEQIEECVAEGDEVGLYYCAKEWDQIAERWVADGNESNVEKKIIESFKAFRQGLGRECTSFRFGGEGLTNRVILLLEELGARFDLSLQGAGSIRSTVSALEGTSNTTHPMLIPVTPYRPRLDDFSQADPARKEGIWMIPLSAGIENDAQFKRGEKPSYRAIDLQSSPLEFEWLANTIVTSFDRPYLVLRVSSSVGIRPRLLRNLKMNLASLLMHPLIGRMVISTPEEALSLLT